tara:strand:+ start:972 stop:3053 length:2082 start_codon:yes stop_codon:yes gene_type:complete
MGSPLGLTSFTKPMQTNSQVTSEGIKSSPSNDFNFSQYSGGAGGEGTGFSNGLGNNTSGGFGGFGSKTNTDDSGYPLTDPFANKAEGSQFGDDGNIVNSSYNHVQGIKYVSTDDPTNEVQYQGYTGDYNSIFNESKWYYRPTANTDTNNNNKAVISSSKRHDSDIYDISTNSIIDYTNQEGFPALKLDPAHFVYLKDYGVYPNNRLIVCRRFGFPVENNLTSYSEVAGHAHSTLQSTTPLSTIVSWIPDDADDFFSFETSEEWKDHSTVDPVSDLSNIFNKVIGKALPFTPGSEMMGGITAISNLLPIGGIPETLTIAITNYLLGSDENPAVNFSYDNLHQGNPNFMGQSTYRDVNSITSNITIPIKVVYEMKYLNGIDPTIAFMDVVQNLLRFSSSQSIFYMSQSGGDNINKIIEKFKNGDWIGIIRDVIDVVIKAVSEVFTWIKETIKKIPDYAKQGKDFLTRVIDGDVDFSDSSGLIDQVLSKISRSALSRYRIEFNKLIPSMSGFASAPWHVTIGNPKNPFFSSGDMIVEGGKVTFGNILGFNDLPTRIEFEFNIKSARNLGIQEIFDKFNTGAGRQYQRDTIEFKVDWNQGAIKASEAKINKEMEDEKVMEQMRARNQIEAEKAANVDPYTLIDENGISIPEPYTEDQQKEVDAMKKLRTDAELPFVNEIPGLPGGESNFGGLPNFGL